jgi:uncharacterized SAM-binding protein YcdF (DUF218 family)
LILVRGIAAVVLFVALAALFVGRLVVWPNTDRPKHADAVVVLSGDHGERLPVAMRLIKEGVTNTLVLVGEPDSAEGMRLCAGGQPFEVVCPRPRPDNTRAEARATAELAARRGWKRVVVSTTTFHVTRSRILFGRCLGRDPMMVAGKPPYHGRVAAQAVLHEIAGVAYALTWARGC